MKFYGVFILSCINSIIFSYVFFFIAITRWEEYGERIYAFNGGIYPITICIGIFKWAFEAELDLLSKRRELYKKHQAKELEEE